MSANNSDDRQERLEQSLNAAFEIFIKDRISVSPLDAHPIVMKANKDIFAAGFMAAYSTFVLEQLKSGGKF
jgi:hypothetical protein